MRAQSCRWLPMLLLFAATSVFAIHYPRMYVVTLAGNDPGDALRSECDATVCFLPSPLTVIAGDYVMFSSASGGSLEDEGPPQALGLHNVVADDGSFRCALGCDGEGGDGSPRDTVGLWYATRKFDAPGVFGYHDEVSGTRGVIIVMPDESSPSAAVEYYYADWNFYFVTATPEEIAALDGGAFGGVWQRTGQGFNVWDEATTGAVPTCRFFSAAFAPKSSHFYTPYAEECASLQAGTIWQFEGIAFFVELPDAAGLCPGGSVPLYRVYNNGLGGAPNHRYATSLAILDQMLAAGWVLEGNGTTGAFACVPA